MLVLSDVLSNAALLNTGVFNNGLQCLYAARIMTK